MLLHSLYFLHHTTVVLKPERSLSAQWSSGWFSQSLKKISISQSSRANIHMSTDRSVHPFIRLNYLPSPLTHGMLLIYPSIYLSVSCWGCLYGPDGLILKVSLREGGSLCAGNFEGGGWQEVVLRGLNCSRWPLISILRLAPLAVCQ